jgi:putative transposase
LPGDFIAERPVNSVIQPAGLPTATPHIEVLQRPRESAQYTSFAFQQELDDHGVLASIGSVGDAYDNAMAESFVDTFKTELIADRVWRTRSQLELAIVEWVAWFNTERLHESLGDIPPAELEALYAAQTGQISPSE